MLHIAMIEDEEKAKDVITSYLDRFFGEKKGQFSSEWFSNPLEFLKRDSHEFDLVFLDIEMPEMNGMDVAKKIRETNENVALIFITNIAQYAIKGYEVEAMDYIIKPVSYYDFALKIERVINKLKKNDEGKISILCEGESLFLLYKNIVYVEVMKHNLIYHTADKEYVVRSSMKKIEDVFLTNGFAKCNNYCLVNLAFVRGVKGYDLLLSVGGKESTILISHPRKKEFVHSLNKYIGMNI
ncbi:MAG: LytTR family DNA-binding domain-containing protein [Bacilli bacterium]